MPSRLLISLRQQPVQDTVQYSVQNTVQYPVRGKFLRWSIVVNYLYRQVGDCQGSRFVV